MSLRNQIDVRVGPGVEWITLGDILPPNPGMEGMSRQTSWVGGRLGGWAAGWVGYRQFNQITPTHMDRFRGPPLKYWGAWSILEIFFLCV